MSRALSTVALESLAGDHTEEAWLVLLTISHPDLATPIRVVHNNEAVTSRGETFLAYAFELELPTQSPEGPGEAQITIDNVDRVIVNTVRSFIDPPPRVLIEVVLHSNPDEVEISFPQLIMRDVTFDKHRVTGALRMEDISMSPIAHTITPSRFPALF